MSVFFVLAALIFWQSPVFADPVNEALQKAREQTNQNMKKDNIKPAASAISKAAPEQEKPAIRPDAAVRSANDVDAVAKPLAATHQTDTSEQSVAATAPADKTSQADAAQQDVAPQVPEQSVDTDNAAPLQATYPGVENKMLQTGGDGDPVSSLWYPQFGNAKVDEALKAFVEAQAREYEDELKDSLGENGEKPESWSSWEQTGFYTLERPNPDVVSITFNVYSYIGGAHGQIVICVLNFNLKTGKMLTFADLFADPQKAIAIMSELCAKKLVASLGEDADEEMIKDGTEATDANFSNLSLLPDGLDVEFQPYQVGPWSIGQQQVKLSLQDLAPAGPNPAIWPTAMKS